MLGVLAELGLSGALAVGGLNPAEVLEQTCPLPAESIIASTNEPAAGCENDTSDNALLWYILTPAGLLAGTCGLAYAFTEGGRGDTRRTC